MREKQRERWSKKEYEGQKDSTCYTKSMRVRDKHYALHMSVQVTHTPNLRVPVGLHPVSRSGTRVVVVVSLVNNR